MHDTGVAKYSTMLFVEYTIQCARPFACMLSVHPRSGSEKASVQGSPCPLTSCFTSAGIWKTCLRKLCATRPFYRWHQHKFQINGSVFLCVSSKPSLYGGKKYMFYGHHIVKIKHFVISRILLYWSLPYRGLIVCAHIYLFIYLKTSLQA